MMKKKRTNYSAPQILMDAVVEVENFIASSQSGDVTEIKEGWNEVTIGDEGEFSGEFQW